MNTVAFSRLLARKLSVEDPTAPRGDAALDILAAINAGLNQFFANAPARLKRTTVSATVRAPETVNVTFDAQYSREITTEEFEDDMRGCTVLFDASPIYNEIVNATTVLDEYLSATLTTTGAVYHDAIAIEDSIKRITSDVRLYSANGCRKKLTRDDTLRERRNDSPTVGEPCYYVLDPVGSSQGLEPEAFLRLWPLPGSDYIIRFEAELGAKRIEFAHLINAIELPLDENLVEDILLPICVGELTDSPFWKDASKVSKAETAAEKALKKISLIANDYALPNNTVGTPEGF